MSIRSILVNVDLTTGAPVNYAASLAKEFDATLFGVAADQPPFVFAGVDAVQVSVDYYAEMRAEVEKGLLAAEERFRAAVPVSVKSRWQASIADVTDTIIDAAVAADLIVTGQRSMSSFGEARDINLGHLILASGRPILVVGDESTAFKCNRIVIGWKDTREARRAVVDALPFLNRATDIVAVTISEGDVVTERAKLDELVAWLAAHGVTARSELIESDVGFIDVLESTARAYQADLVVAGGYGHSRMREWLFGGVTKNLIEASSLNRLFSN
jgi:nucleotide-binding universal stress UspA family protein